MYLLFFHLTQPFNTKLFVLIQKKLLYPILCTLNGNLKIEISIKGKKPRNDVHNVLIRVLNC
jgi:hypothetical protein